jgi:hypothetical protein
LEIAEILGVLVICREEKNVYSQMLQNRFFTPLRWGSAPRSFVQNDNPDFCAV